MAVLGNKIDVRVSSCFGISRFPVEAGGAVDSSPTKLLGVPGSKAVFKMSKR